MNVTSNNQDVILNSDIIILAVKPHQILDVMKEVHDTYVAVQQQAGSRTTTTPRSFRPLIVSVATSISLADIEEKVSCSVYFPSLNTNCPPRFYIWSPPHQESTLELLTFFVCLIGRDIVADGRLCHLRPLACSSLPPYGGQCSPLRSHRIHQGKVLQ